MINSFITLKAQVKKTYLSMICQSHLGEPYIYHNLG